MDGKVSGKIVSTNIVSIGANGRIEGELSAQRLIVSGIFEGVAECDRVELLKSGKIYGKIVAKDLMIESGSIFEGESRLKRNGNTKILSKDSASKSL